MHSGTPNSQARPAWHRGALRAGGTAVAAAFLVGLVPGVAQATPGAPSDGEISSAQAQADAVAARIGELDGQLAAAQAGVDSAREQALPRARPVPGDRGGRRGRPRARRGRRRGRRARPRAARCRPRRPRRLRPPDLHGGQHQPRASALITAGSPARADRARRAARGGRRAPQRRPRHRHRAAGAGAAGRRRRPHRGGRRRRAQGPGAAGARGRARPPRVSARAQQAQVAPRRPLSRPRWRPRSRS